MNTKVIYLFFIFGLFSLPITVFAQQPQCKDILDHCIKTIETQTKNCNKACLYEDIDIKILLNAICEGFFGHKVGSSKFHDCIKNEVKKCQKECGKNYHEGTNFCWESYNYCKEKREKLIAKNFPEKLTVVISANCQWKWLSGNIHEYSSYSYNVQGVVNLKERKKDFLRYESKNLNAVYDYKSIGIMKMRGDKCYEKIVGKSSGNSNSSANFILDIYLGNEWGKVTPFIKKDSYSVFLNFGGNILHEHTENTCELTGKKHSVKPFSFTITPYQPLFSTAMAGIKKAGEPGFVCPGNGYLIWEFK